MVAKWLKRTPFVFEVRDLWPELPREMKVITNPIILSLLGALEWMSYKSADRLIGLSPGIVRGIERHNIELEKIALIPNGCDLDIFNSQKQPWRPKGVSQDNFMAVFTGAHGIANGLDAVLDAAAELLKTNNTNIKIVLIGQGKLKGSLKSRAIDENLNNIIFLDPVPKDELVGLMASADVGLQVLANIESFYYGTSPNKFFDYLASGLPVITNYPGWVADLISVNNCGYVTPPSDSKAFANTLIKAEKNKEASNNLRMNALKLAKTEFSRESLGLKFVSWIENK